MDDEEQDLRELKPWTCSGDRHHILGLVRRNGSGIRQLLLYRQAVDIGGRGVMEEVDVMAVVEGYVTDVTCSICRCARTWVPGEEALNRLLDQVRKSRARN